MMKTFLCSIILLFAIPLSLSAARVQCTLPEGLPQASLLSGGTATMLEYEKAKAKAGVAKLKGEYQVDGAETGSNKGSREVGLAKKAYADKASSLRRHYISLLAISLSSVHGDINPSTSALAEVAYSYTAKNSSEKVITDITYRPLINGKPLRTPTTFVLEFIDPSTLKAGLGPGETMTNQGHDPEKFSFFLGEASPEEVNAMKKDLDRKFGIEVMDMHFSDRKDYKGQFKPLSFEEAFAFQLAPLQQAVRLAEVRAKELGDSDTKALKEFKARKDTVMDQERKALAGLKKSAVRYTASPDKKGRFIFEDVAPGTYFIYAGNGLGMAVFEKITVGDERKLKKTITQMKKDPFVP